MANLISFESHFNQKQIKKQSSLVRELLKENEAIFCQLVESAYLQTLGGVSICKSLLAIQSNLLEIKKCLFELEQDDFEENLDCEKLMHIGRKIRETNELRERLLAAKKTSSSK